MANLDNYGNTRSEERYSKDPGPFLARVVSHGDVKYMGSLQVELLNDVGRPLNRTGSVIQVEYLNPFYGVTSSQFVTKNNDYAGTQKSYGMWMVPPDVGNIVLVMFVNGDASRGFWLGCVQSDYMNFMVPGLAASSSHVNPSDERQVVAELNSVANNSLLYPDQTMVPKPVHPFQEVLKTQGLAKDDIRGITTSSARRESPSAVFGISTPGPLDTKSGAPSGLTGKKESQKQSFVSRLGGTTFVMDDGDDAFLRKTKASDGPPEYASVENNETGGIPDIPHNELVRIRTRSGHQILLHNSEDLIYIGNAKGTTWIELTSNGKIDIYANDSISIHTEQDLNIKADRDINLEAVRDINMRAGRNVQIESKEDYGLIVGKDGKINVTKSYNLTTGTGTKVTTLTGNTEILSTTGSNSFTAKVNTNILSSNSNYFTATNGSNDISSKTAVTMSGTIINLNGPAAGAAPTATSAVVPTAVPVVSKRIPLHEPWGGHENLHNPAFPSDSTKTPTASGYMPAYTTATDTFKKISK